MAWLADVRAQKDSFLRGAAFLLGGFALVLAGTLVGLQGSKWAQVAAGTVAVTGVIVMFLGAFLYVVPPLLPSK